MSFTETASHSPDFFFDISEGRLIVGDQAFADAVGSGTHPSDIHPFRDVIIKAMPHTLEKEVPLEVSTWSMDDYVSLTSWLGRQVVGEETRLIDDHFHELHKLGLGPSPKMIGARGGYSALYEKAGLVNVYKRGIYNEWTIDEFTEHVCRIARATPKTASIKGALTDLSRSGEGPSYKVISARVPGGLKKLLARGGFYDFQKADLDDFIEWGVDFKFANGGIAIEASALDALSPKRRAPSRGGIPTHFGTMANFNNIVDARYFEELDRIESRNRDQFQKIMEALNVGDLPTSLFVDCSSESEMRHVAGKYWLIRKLCGGMEARAIAALAQKSSKSVVTEIMKRNKDVMKIADIEEAALVLDVFDDVWPVAPKNGLKL